MNSNDITLTLIYEGLKELKADVKDLQTRVTKLESLVETNSKENAIAHNYLDHGFYWGFALIAIVIALCGFLIALAPTILEYFKQKINFLSRENIRAIMIDVLKDHNYAN